MTITVTLRTDNAAFDGDDLAPEVARILRGLAGTVERELTREADGFSVALRDINGNKVGDCDILD